MSEAVEAGGGAPASSDGGAETSTSRSRFPDWQDIETILSEHLVEQTISSLLGRRAKATFPTQEVKQEVEEEAEEGVGGLPAVQPNLRPPTWTSKVEFHFFPTRAKAVPQAFPLVGPCRLLLMAESSSSITSTRRCFRNSYKRLLIVNCRQLGWTQEIVALPLSLVRAMFPTGFRKQTWILMNTICPYPFRFIHMIWTSEVKEFMMNTSQATPRWPWSSSWGLGRACSYGWKDLLHRPQHKVSLTRDCFLPTSFHLACLF